MISAEFCDSTGLTPRDLQKWLDTGLLEAADMIGRTVGGGLRREFTRDQAERARANLSFDGQELRACRDAAAAIAEVVRAKRWCSAVDLAAFRTGAAEL